MRGGAGMGAGPQRGWATSILEDFQSHFLCLLPMRQPLLQGLQEINIFTQLVLKCLEGARATKSAIY